MEPLQPEILPCFICPYSNTPITRLCTFHSCKDKNPLICESCEDGGCIKRHTHDEIRKYRKFDEIKQFLQNLPIPHHDISTHIEDIKAQLVKLVADLQVMAAQHFESMSSKTQFKFNNKAQKILNLIQQNQWESLSGSHIDYVLRDQIFDDKSKASSAIQFQKNRIFKILEGMRKNIAQYYYNRQKKNIDQYLKQAEIKRQSRDYEAAIKLYSKILELHPNQGEALSYRGLCYSQNKQYQKALNDYDLCLELNPRHAQTMSNIGYIYYSQNIKVIALLWYNKSIAIDCQNPITLYNRGVLYMSLERYKQAQVDLIKALQSQKSREFYQKLAKCYDKLGQKQKCIGCMQMIKELHL